MNKSSSTPAPQFSILITSFRSLRFLEDCLGSLLKSTGPSFEILFLENGSPEPEADWIEKHIRDPRLRVFRLANTRYFAGGINFLARHAQGEFLVLLNSDTQVEPDWLRILDEYLKKSGFEAAQADLREPKNPRQRTRGYCLDRMGLVVEIPKEKMSPSGRAFCVCGAAFAIRRDVFYEIGALDETLRMYFEDIDLCWRINLFGYRVGFASGAIVHHVGGGSSRKSFFQWNYFRSIRNRALSFVKNSGPVMLAQFLAINLLVRIIRFPINVLLGKFGKAISEAAAVLSFFWLLGSALSKRRDIQAKRKVTDSELISQGFILSRLKYSGRLGKP